MNKKLQCPECGKGYLKKEIAELVGSRKGEPFPIRMEALVCSKCHFKTVPQERAAQFALRTANAYRQVHGLLTSMEIKDLRCQLHMTQKQFANFLHVGVASVKRWELGEIQDAAMNRLIVLAVAQALGKREKFSPWGGHQQIQAEEITHHHEEHAAGIAGLPNGPPLRASHLFRTKTRSGTD